MTLTAGWITKRASGLLKICINCPPKFSVKICGTESSQQPANSDSPEKWSLK